MDENRKKLEDNLQDFAANQEHYEMALRNVDKMFFMRYKSLMDAGFSENQAFEIVKYRGLT